MSFLAPDRSALAHAGPTMLNQPPIGNSSHLLQRTGNDATRYLLPVFGRHRNLAGELIPDEADACWAGSNWNCPTTACCAAIAACSPAC